MPTPADVFGALEIPDDEHTYVHTFGQEPIYDATMALLGNHNADLAAAEAIFVERETVAHTSRYYLDTGTRLSKKTNQTRAEAVKVQGSWDVAYPLEEWGRTIAGNRIQMAYMSTAQYGRHIAALLNSDINTRRHEMLNRVLDNGAGSPLVFYDEIWGNLNVQPLANGDATLYPPVVGSEANATANNYLVTNFAPGAITDTNDPYTPAFDALEGHFGMPTAGSNIVTFINSAQVKLTQAMSGFNPIEHRFQRFGDDVSRAVNYSDSLPGRVLGEFEGKGLIVRWDWIPANYTWTIHLDAPKPLTRRVDPPGTGLSPGLQLLAQEVHQPFMRAEWSNRFGYGVGNRLNGIVTYIATGTTYVVPTTYGVGT